MNEAERQRVEEVREHLGRYLFYKKYPPSNDPLAYNMRWEDIPFDGCDSKQPFYNQVNDLLKLKDPKGNPYIYIAHPDQSFHLASPRERRMTIYAECQNNMWKDDWRRVILEEEDNG